MHELPRPRVIFSACLLGDRVRYDGDSATDEFALRLSKIVDVVKVCPEMELGLGTPRPKIILYKDGSEVFAYQKETGRFFTEALRSLADSVIKNLGPLDGVLLKSRSPSCGVSGTKIYADSSGKKLIGKGRGIFAEELINRMSEIPVEDEERLRRFRTLRLRFLMGVFTRAIIREGSWRDLAEVMENVSGKRMKFERVKAYHKRARTDELKSVLEKVLGVSTVRKLLEA